MAVFNISWEKMLLMFKDSLQNPLRKINICQGLIKDAVIKNNVSPKVVEDIKQIVQDIIERCESVLANLEK